MTNLKQLIYDKFSIGHFFYSIEIFPPKSEDELDRLYENLDSFLKKFKILFCDITYHSHNQKPIGHPCSSLTIGNYLIKNFKIQTVLHLTCIDKTLTELDILLDKAKELNIQNLLVLRGDSSDQKSKDDNLLSQQKLNYANEFVSYIRKRFDSYFTLAVAGYPSISEDLIYLKKKVDSKADFILTQVVFDANEFIESVRRCRNFGIQVPIIAGILPIDSAKSIKRILKLCKVKVPNEFINFLELNDEQKNLDFIVNFYVDLAKKIIESESTVGLHFYTMNNFNLTENILTKLNEGLKDRFCIKF